MGELGAGRFGGGGGIRPELSLEGEPLSLAPAASPPRSAGGVACGRDRWQPLLLADPGRPWALASGHPRVSPALESVHARTEAEQIGRKRRGSATTSTDAPVQPEDAMRVSQGENGRSVKDQQAQLAGTPLRHPARPKGEVESTKRAQHPQCTLYAARGTFPLLRLARQAGSGAGGAGRSVSPLRRSFTCGPDFTG